MTQQVNYGTTHLGEIEVALQGGQSALWGHIVSLRLTARLVPAGPGSDPVELEVAPVDVFMGGKWLGVATPEPGQATIHQRTYVATERMTLRLFLEPARLRALEELRNGGGVTWRLACSYAFKTAGDAVIVSEQEEMTIAQGVWVPLLEQMGYQRTLLLEVPIPDTHHQPELAQAVTLLTRAQKLIAEGQYSEAVGMCRDVLEEVSRALKDENGDDLQDQGLFEGTRKMTKAQRLRLVRRAAKVLTHPARHRDEVAVATEWSRIDAVSIVTITAALIQELQAPGAIG